MSKITFYFLQKKNSLLLRYRRLKFHYFFGRLDIYIGSNVKVIIGRGEHSFGTNVKIYDNVIFEVHGFNTKIALGNNCILSFGVLINCTKKIQLGNNVWVGEYSSIRDATHDFSGVLGTLDDIQEEIIIGNNVWIGRGSLILPNTKIEDNVIIAAHSVVKGDVKGNSIYGGCPAVFIKRLNYK